MTKEDRLNNLNKILKSMYLEYDKAIMRRRSLENSIKTLQEQIDNLSKEVPNE